MKIKGDIFWNYVSLMIMAIMGLAINSIIIKFYNSSVLGIYNETYTWYMILSQISVWGLHMAVVKYVPETEDAEERCAILNAALLMAILTSATTIVVAFVLMSLLDFSWKLSLHRAVLGLLMFSVNKVFLNYLNAAGKMTLYAMVQSVRYFLLMFIMAPPTPVCGNILA